jgi:hypothetical protein
VESSGELALALGGAIESRELGEAGGVLGGNGKESTEANFEGAEGSPELGEKKKDKTAAQGKHRGEG